MSKLQPWLSPDDSVEALEIMTEVSESLRNTAIYGSLRKQLRDALQRQAGRLDEFVHRANHGVIDPALLLALEALAKDRRSTVNGVIMEALEHFISGINRRKSG